METRVTQKKNGKLEFYRFVACVYILCFHANKYVNGEHYPDGIHLHFFPNGSLGVEFFFLLSGFFLAAGIYKKVSTMDNLSNQALSVELVDFMKKKYVRIFPEHLIAFVLTFISFSIIHQYYSIKELALLLYDNVPNILLIQETGINYRSINHVEWYLSCMLICMAIIYPICRKFYYCFTRYFAPLIGLLGIGYIICTTGALTGVHVWMTFTIKGMLRAFCELCLGTTAFEITRCLKEKYKRNYSGKLQLTCMLLDILLFAYTLFFVLFTIGKPYQVYIVFAFMILIIINAAEIPYGCGLFQNKVVYFLGAISLPIYLGQLAAIYLVTGLCSTYSHSKQIALIIVITILFALLIMGIKKVCNRIITFKERRVDGRS